MDKKNSSILKTSSVCFEDDLELFFTKYEESLSRTVYLYMYLGVPSFFEKQRCIMRLSRDFNCVWGIEVYSVEKT